MPEKFNPPRFVGATGGRPAPPEPVRETVRQGGTTIIRPEADGRGGPSWPHDRGPAQGPAPASRPAPQQSEEVITQGATSPEEVKSHA